MIASRKIDESVRKTFMANSKYSHIVSHPVIRYVDGKFLLAAFALFFKTEEEKKELKVRRPPIYCLVNMASGRIEASIDCRKRPELDFSDASDKEFFSMKDSLPDEGEQTGILDEMYRHLDAARQACIEGQTEGGYHTACYRKYFDLLMKITPRGIRRFYDELSEPEAPDEKKARQAAEARKGKAAEDEDGLIPEGTEEIAVKRQPEETAGKSRVRTMRRTGKPVDGGSPQKEPDGSGNKPGQDTSQGANGTPENPAGDTPEDVGAPHGKAERHVEPPADAAGEEPGTEEAHRTEAADGAEAHEPEGGKPEKPEASASPREEAREDAAERKTARGNTDAAKAPRTGAPHSAAAQEAEDRKPEISGRDAGKLRDDAHGHASGKTGAPAPAGGFREKNKIVAAERTGARDTRTDRRLETPPDETAPMETAAVRNRISFRDVRWNPPEDLSLLPEKYFRAVQRTAAYIGFLPCSADSIRYTYPLFCFREDCRTEAEPWQLMQFQTANFRPESGHFRIQAGRSIYTSCSGRNRCLFATCPYALAAYYRYLAETNPEEIIRQRNKYRENKTARDLEKAAFEMRLPCRCVSAEDLDFGKRCVESGLYGIVKRDAYTFLMSFSVTRHGIPAPGGGTPEALQSFMAYRADLEDGLAGNGKILLVSGKPMPHWAACTILADYLIRTGKFAEYTEFLQDTGRRDSSLIAAEGRRLFRKPAPGIKGSM